MLPVPKVPSFRLETTGIDSCNVDTFPSPVGLPVWLLFHKSMHVLAKKICNACTDCIVSPEDSKTMLRLNSTLEMENHQEPATKFPRQTSGAAAISQPLSFPPRLPRQVQLMEIVKWKTFPDSFPNLFINDVKEIAGRDIIFLASFHSPEVIFEQLSLIFQIPRQLVKSFTIILPYFPTGTMERVDTEGQIATAKTLAIMLSAVPMTARGPTQIMIFDIHNLAERFYFGETIIPRLETAIPLLKRAIRSLAAEINDISISFPDDGAFKRFHTQFPRFEREDKMITCVKIRDKDKRIVKIKDGDPRGRHCIIVDDLVMTGGTLIECAKALYKAGATKVSAFVTHAVFPGDSWKRFAWSDKDDENALFRNFWITDSLPHAEDICKHKPFELLSLNDVIADTLLGYDLIKD